MTLYNGLIELVDISIVALVVFTLIIIYTRVVGLRTFAKMSSTDVITTLAVGSMVASVILPSKFSVVGGCFGIMALYFLQWLSSWMKVHVPFFSKIHQNSPVILMKDGKVFRDQLSNVNMTEADLQAKLREANALDINKVKYVVFESTGDVSVLHGDQPVSDYVVDNLN